MFILNKNKQYLVCKSKCTIRQVEQYTWRHFDRDYIPVHKDCTPSHKVVQYKMADKGTLIHRWCSRSGHCLSMD